MKLFDKVASTATLCVPGTDIAVPPGAIGIIMNPVFDGQRVQVTFEQLKRSTYNIPRDCLALVREAGAPR